MSASNLKPYPDYKFLDNELIDKLPADWSLVRIKNLIDSRKYYQLGDGDHGSIKPSHYQDHGVPYIRVQNLSWSHRLNPDGLVYLPNDIHNENSKSALFPGDILVAKTGATIGKTAIIPESMLSTNTTSSVAKLTVDKTRYDTKFCCYCLMSDILHHQIWAEAMQKSAQPGFDIEDFKIFFLPNPSLDEQQQISNFLDYACTWIHEIISALSKNIELLEEKRSTLLTQVITKGLNSDVKMKDSGNKWIGKIPAHWNISRLKYHANIKGRIGFRGYTVSDLVEPDEEALTLGATHISSSGEIDLSSPVYISWEKYFESPEIMVSEGDILIVQRVHVEKLDMYQMIGPATINPSLAILKNTTFDSGFMNYLPTLMGLKNY